MKKSVKITSGILGFIMLLPGLAKFMEPFKTFIYQHLTLIHFPLPGIMQYVVKFSEVGVGLAMLLIAFKGSRLSDSSRNKVFYLGNATIVIMMAVAIYTHLHPNVPAEILPMEYKPPIMAISYILLVCVNLYLNRKDSA